METLTIWIVERTREWYSASTSDVKSPVPFPTLEAAMEHLRSIGFEQGPDHDVDDAWIDAKRADYGDGWTWRHVEPNYVARIVRTTMVPL